MTDYIHSVKNIIDSLASSGVEISYKKYRHYVIKGLDSAYESIVSSLITTMGVITKDDFESMLLSYDLRLTIQNQVHISQPHANVASSNCGRDVPLMRDGGRDVPLMRDGTSEIIFQICDKPYHGARECHKRLNMVTYPSRDRRKPLKGNDNRGNMPPSCTTTSSPAAYATYQQPNYTYDCLPDSGATNHMTNNLNNLEHHYEYAGPDHVRTAGGSNLTISIPVMVYFLPRTVSFFYQIYFMFHIFSTTSYLYLKFVVIIMFSLSFMTLIVL